MRVWSKNLMWCLLLPFVGACNPLGEGHVDEGFQAGAKTGDGSGSGDGGSGGSGSGSGSSGGSSGSSGGPLSISLVSPLKGSTLGSTKITVTGTGFSSSSTSVTVAGSTCTSLSVASATSLTCSTPVKTAGAADVEVYNTGGYSAIKEDGYTYVTSDSWSPITSVDAPSSRIDHTAVWTGSKMVAWGGTNGAALNSGGIYDPAEDKWTATSTTNAPTARYGHTAVWTGSQMIIWGGRNENGDSVMNDGGIFDPDTNSWSTMASGGSVLSKTSYHVAVWDSKGSRMIIWGGTNNTTTGENTHLNTGGIFTLSSNTWTATPTNGAPGGRWFEPVLLGIWTGTELIFYGGLYRPSNFYIRNDGAKFNPTTNGWASMASSSSAPGAKTRHAIGWYEDGKKMVAWGGATSVTNSGEPSPNDFNGYSNTGSVYDYLIDEWSAMATTNAPTGRRHMCTASVGNKWILFGGFDGSSAVASGGVYNVSNNSWGSTTTTGAGSARYQCSAISTGGQMFVFGGTDGGSYYAQGRIYTP